MPLLSEHPTVKRFNQRRKTAAEEAPPRLDAGRLRQLCFDTGADDVGFVEIDRPALRDQRADIIAAFPRVKTLISFVCRMNRDDLRSPARSVANLEFHRRGDEVDEIAGKIVAALEQRGIRAVNPAMGFPMEMDRFGNGKTWVISHKPVAVEAGLGHMGIHRNVIHPKFGNFILLGMILMEAEVSAYDAPVDYNPCLECKLCVAACPVGAIGSDGHFDFSSCYTHNYREFMGGFTDWVETIADAKNALDYRRKVNASETASMWQSLSFGANYKSAYCMAVCPAGDDVIGPFLTDRKRYLSEVLKPLQDKEETVYVVPGSDAENYLSRRFPHKKAKRIGNGLRTRSIRAFLVGLRYVFQRNRSEGLDATYHFTFTGEENCKTTVIIKNKTIEIKDGHVGAPGIRVRADSHTWLAVVGKEQSLLWALIRRKIRVKGSPKLLTAFARCFPS